MGEDNDKEGIVDPLRLSSCHLIEVAADDSFLWSWSYPHLSPQFRNICLSKCNTILAQKAKNFKDDEAYLRDDGRVIMQGRNFHLDKLWFYVVFPGRPDGERVPGADNAAQIKMVGVIIVAEDFHPEMYERVGNVLYLTYMKTGDPSIVLQQFLSLIVEGSCLLPKKKIFTLSNYGITRPYVKHNIKEIILRFGLETILIHTALLRKKRIVVYHSDIDVLSDFTLSLPILCGEFSNEIWNSVYPWVDLNEDELSFIKNKASYVMGCTVAGVENSSDLFDVFINIPAAEIYVAPHARESIPMNKAHKEMATFMVQLASDEAIEEEELVSAIIKRNAEIKIKL